MKIIQKIAKQIMAILVIAVLFIPGLIMYEAEKQTVNRVIELEGLYLDGTIINITPINKTHVESQFFNEVIIGSVLNNDSYIYADNGITKQLYYPNWVTYIGNGTYHINIDTTEPNFTIAPLVSRFGMPININGTTFAKFDFVRITMNQHSYPYDVWFKYWFPFKPLIWAGERSTFSLEQNTEITHTILFPLLHYYRLDFTQYVDINGYPDFNIFVELWATTDNFTLKIEGFNFDETHKVFWNEEKILYLSLGFTASILTVGTVFSTKLINIKTGNKKIKRKSK